MTHALVHSGGGANGAWGVGVLRHLFLNLGVKPNFWVGTSVGGLNGAIVCQHPVGDEEAALLHLQAVWATVEPEAIYKHWCPGGSWGDMRGAVCKSSIYNTSPLRKFVRQHLDEGALRSSGRPLHVSLVDLSSGELIYVTQDHTDIYLAVLGTSSYPFFFSPVRFEGSLVSDGGLREITPLKRAVDEGASVIDVITCQTETMLSFSPKGKTTLELGPRFLDAMSTEINNNDLAFDHKVGPPVKIRLWQPQMNLGSGLDFHQDKAQRLQELGFQYAESCGDQGTRSWSIGGEIAS